MTVTGQNEAGVDLVLMQPFLLSYKNHAVVMLTKLLLLALDFHKKARRVASKQDQPQPHFHP